MKKKLMFAMLTAFMLPNVILAQSESSFVTDFGKELSYSEYEKMHSLGYDDAFLKQMPNRIIERYLSEDIELVSKEVHHYQEVYTYSNSDMLNACGNNCTFDDVKEGAVPISVNDYEIFGNSSYSQISDNVAVPFVNTNKFSQSNVYKKRTQETRVFYVEGSNTFNLVNAVMWDGVPDKKSYDVNAIGFSTPGVIIVDNSQYAFQTYVEYGLGGKQTKEVDYSTNSDHYKFNTNAIGITMNLADGDFGKGTRDHILYLEYQVKKSVTNTINTLNVTATYKHATFNASLGDFIGVALDPSALGIAVFFRNAVEDKYDDGNYTKLICTNLNW